MQSAKIRRSIKLLQNITAVELLSFCEQLFEQLGAGRYQQYFLAFFRVDKTQTWL